MKPSSLSMPASLRVTAVTLTHEREDEADEGNLGSEVGFPGTVKHSTE